ncbi:5'-nucleotidase C-terminal domain-containing protein [Paenibacillus brevis]|uniref:5'-nucleotidase C-terminal domain-containing protein n=1 Tax=Paenibacillus brevis TaxID=2841508 RepID=A0ABS6FPL4_9BACL|nr:5'-nucleotidase C-terminal domain-containing protein [Paenibacillus brevis]MBU5671398.1 5'-nucleotidase C-terminal domain-containing protein [Paenibacillus brevis]
MNLARTSFGKLLAAALVATGVLSGAAFGTAQAAETPASTEKFELRVLHTNDTHAHLDNIARRVTAVNEVRNDSTLLLDAGDVFSGTLYFNQFNGLADLFFMNKLNYDAMTFGNHEFDKGPEGLIEFVKAAKFPFVSANIDFSKEPILSAYATKDIGAPGKAGNIYPSIIKEIQGEKVGIIGLTTPESAVLASPGENIKFADEVESARKQVEALEAKGINKIVVLSHLGYTVDQELAEAVEGIDIIVGGHSHTQLNEAEVHHADGEPTLIVQTGEYNKYLGQLDVVFDGDGVLTEWQDKLISLDAQNDAGEYLIKGDAESEAKLKEYEAPLEELKQTVIGKTLVDLDGERNNVRTQETNLGDLVADGMRAKVMSIVKESDVAGYVTIQNGGGIRASIGAGDITLGHLLTTMPFGNNLSALKMTGEEIVAALENGVSGVENGEGRFPQISGMRFYYDSTKAGDVIDAVTGAKTQEGNRIVQVQIKQANGSYSDIDPKAYYIVATNSYMADGGDFYKSMKQAKNAGRFYELNLVDYEVFREYLDSVGTVNVQPEGRIIDVKGASLSVAFSDVSGHANAAVIEKAAAAGIINGYADGSFRPDNKVTRAELAVMVSRALKLQASTNVTGFTDEAAIPGWALPSVAALKEAGLLEGVIADSFEPSKQVTAGEVAKVLAAVTKGEAQEGDVSVTLSRGEIVSLLVQALN